MAILNSNGILLVDAIPVHTPTATQARLARLEDTLTLYYYNGAAWTTIDVDALSGITPDGTDTPIVRGDALTGVAPTAGEAAGPISGDTASVFLTDGVLEKWVHNGTAWALAYTLAANEAANLTLGTVTATTVDVDSSSGSNATLTAATTAAAGVMTAALFDNLANIITLSGVAADATNNGSFTGATITDNVTTKVALQELETALEAITSSYITSVADTNSIDLVETGGALTANVKRSATQDGQFAITESADGLTLTKVALTAYDSHALADAAVAIGDSYLLTATNLEGVASDGNSGPVFRRV